MHKKYFFFDIDGTLTDEATHLIVPSAEQTLHELENNGHFVSIATGRAHYKAVSFTNSIGIKNLVCAGGGCLVLNGKVVRNEPLPNDKAISLLEHADKDHIGWILMLDDSDKVYFHDYRFLETAGLRTELTTYCYDPQLDYHHLPAIYKIYLAYTKEQEQSLSWINDLGRLRMGETYCVYQYDAKKTGILEMMKVLQAPLEDVVVFGDASNDLVMFDPQWISIAMGNGSEELKKKATYVTDKNVNDGIRKACLHFHWI